MDTIITLIFGIAWLCFRFPFMLVGAILGFILLSFLDGFNYMMWEDDE